MRGVEGYVGLVEIGAEAGGPEVEVAAGTVEEDDGGVGVAAGRGFGLLGEEADGGGVDLDEKVVRHMG